MMKQHKHKMYIKLFAAICAIVMSFSSVSIATAAVKDTDVDGLTDEGEINIYHTDINNPDTDTDGVSDGQEILNGTDPLNAGLIIPQEENFTDPGIFGKPEQFPWYLARAAGILAFILLSASTIFGLVISSRAFIKIVPGVDAFEFHRTLSFASVIAVILHFTSLFFDQYFRLTPAEALVPFLFSRTGIVASAGYDIRIPLALGVIAFYLVIVLVLTAEFRAKMAPNMWRIIHYVSFTAYPLFLLHGFMSGTDSKEGWMRAIYILSVALVASLIIVRIVFRTLIPAIRRVRSSFVKDEASSGTPLS
ncbi:MAG: hypothetical protein HGA31_06875 [Candidatus Moranbacteria bacterium]|nr:hypothetical protein [Candidatus Moranbacteria bacterium]